MTFFEKNCTMVANARVAIVGFRHGSTHAQQLLVTLRDHQTIFTVMAASVSDCLKECWDTPQVKDLIGGSDFIQQ